MRRPGPLDDPQAFLEKIPPLYPRLFATAHAITGSADVAEYALKNALVEAWLRRDEWLGRMRFGQSVLHAVREVALSEAGARESGGADWKSPALGGGNAAWEALGEGDRRIAVLYYGCDLSPRQIARALGRGSGEIARRLRRVRGRLRRTPEGEDGFDRALYEAMGETDRCAGGMGAVLRGFERDAEEASRPRPSARRLAGAAAKIACGVLLAALIWLLAVLLEPDARVSPESGDAAAGMAPVAEKTEEINAAGISMPAVVGYNNGETFVCSS